MKHRIFFSNIGYAKGMDGCLKKHLMHAYRHVYCSIAVQHQALAQLRNIIETEQPDICCLLEIDRGSPHSGYFNQISFLTGDAYPHYDIGDKYGTRLSRMPLHWGKSNAFLAKTPVQFERFYLVSGSKRLVYRLELEGVTLYFAHFSLRAVTRQKQFAEMLSWMKREKGEVILLGDFNVLNGLSELDILLNDTGYLLMNNRTDTTFAFHRHKLLLDICICSPGVARHAKLKVIPQPFSDHDALLLDVDATAAGN